MQILIWIIFFYYYFVGEDYGTPVLTVISVDPCFKENGLAHRTSRYEIMNRTGSNSRLVVRRGQEFYINLTLSRDYDPTFDGLSVVFTLDGVKKPQYGHGTFVVIPLLNPGDVSPQGSWQATIDSLDTNSIRIKVSCGD